MDKKIKLVGANSIKFNRQSISDSACYEYLAATKWVDKTFKYRRCKYTKYSNEKKHL